MPEENSFYANTKADGGGGIVFSTPKITRKCYLEESNHWHLHLMSHSLTYIQGGLLQT